MPDSFLDNPAFSVGADALTTHYQNSLTLTDLTLQYGLRERDEHYDRIKAEAGDYVLAWGFPADRKRVGVPDEIYEIRHAFGTVENPKDTCLVGYWYIWRSGNEELLAEVYRLPNRAVKEAALVSMLEHGAPAWFRDLPGDDSSADDFGTTAPLDRSPSGRGAGQANEPPKNGDQPINVLLIGAPPAAAARETISKR